MLVRRLSNAHEDCTIRPEGEGRDIESFQMDVNPGFDPLEA